ncbi:glycoside hydrolase family 32 protein [Antarcticibacterium flavum]|uniref:Glycoside hydrolase family 32 protein n=1 Tax=Antarcticibacterium flavum TaxID=2058175 RepID=A0A5B7X152_9FLAO|nr:MULTISPECIES: glycoside hydrolase family 32 protein [Antarcticibacterium]MCM4160948.1 glycosyl hydrolase family 32 [Antarcticibacterium sp. W02-3]QCY68990.1 glycoside hydrolase family 32 protein [Antarcticibacterium flavum]
MRPVLICLTVLLSFLSFSCKDDEKSTALNTETPAQSNEDFRPQFHFTPKSGWMNDPNGMFYLDGTYHLFFQHNPDDNVWGPMHWGHATSKDLIVWEEQPIALEPDEHGTIFSGSAVVDHQNTSGLGDGNTPPVIAIFTYHDAEREQEGANDFQTQGIAYSTDAGKTWTKYENNPVLGNPGIRDFRDPKVVWYEEGNKWIMSLAVQDHIKFYSSSNLLDWEHLSDFGKNSGNHGGVWECPDLFKMQVGDTGEERWVLLVSINPGGPNGGSATQYFVGDFDGTTFTLDESVEDIGEEHDYWVDFGKDNYAGVTWSNIPQEDGRHIFMGWMSNWQYANEVPTETWRSAMTIARTLDLKKTAATYRITSSPVKELENYKTDGITKQNIQIEAETEIIKNGEISLSPSVVEVNISNFKEQDYIFQLKNDAGNVLEFGYDAGEAAYYIDRSQSGITDFNEDFASKRSLAPRLSQEQDLRFTAIIDNMSIEIFFDDGNTVMTEIFFPNKPFQTLSAKSHETFKIENFEAHQLNFN